MESGRRKKIREYFCPVWDQIVQALNKTGTHRFSGSWSAPHHIKIPRGNKRWSISIIFAWFTLCSVKLCVWACDAGHEGMGWNENSQWESRTNWPKSAATFVGWCALPKRNDYCQRKPVSRLITTEKMKVLNKFKGCLHLFHVFQQRQWHCYFTTKGRGLFSSWCQQALELTKAAFLLGYLFPKTKHYKRHRI